VAEAVGYENNFQIHALLRTVSLIQYFSNSFYVHQIALKYMIWPNISLALSTLPPFCS